MITVIGSVNMDLIATTPRLPEPGETVSGIRFHHSPGRQGRQPGAGGPACGRFGPDGGRHRQ
jgi:ribokinase